MSFEAYLANVPCELPGTAGRRDQDLTASGLACFLAKGQQKKKKGALKCRFASHVQAAKGFLAHRLHAWGIANG
jgi:hypothetical protein